jgi:hypothetical protein
LFLFFFLPRFACPEFIKCLAAQSQFCTLTSLRNPTSVDRYFADAVLANPAGHDILADVLISYFQSQVCSAWAAATGQSFDGLPPLFSPIMPDNSKQPTDARGLFGGVGQRKGSQPENKEGNVVAGGPGAGNQNPGGQGKVVPGNNRKQERSTSKRSRSQGSTHVLESLEKGVRGTGAVLCIGERPR